MAGPIAYFASGNSRTTACAITCAAECRMTSSGALLTVHASVSAALPQRFAPLRNPMVERPAERVARHLSQVILVGARGDALRAELLVKPRERLLALLVHDDLDRHLSLVVMPDDVLEGTGYELVV